MKLKRHIQILFALMILASSAVFTFLYIYHEQKSADRQSDLSVDALTDSYYHIIEELEYFYQFRAYENLRSEGIADAMIAKNTEALYRIELPRFMTLKEENPSLKIMQFHAADGTSIVRMHQKEKFGDDIASRRPMVRLTHESRKVHSGLEGGIAGIAYRVIVPYIHNGVYAGALEFGVDSRYILQRLQEKNDCTTVMMIHKSRTGAASLSKDFGTIGDYSFIEENQNIAPLLKQYSHHHFALSPATIDWGEKSYRIYPIILTDNDGSPLMSILCIKEIVMDFEALFEALIWIAISTIILMIAAYFFFEYAFGHLISKLEFQENYIHTILNSQKNIVLVSNGSVVLYANQTFLDFFGFATLADFRKDHKDISEFFDEQSSNGYLKKTVDEKTWIEYLVDNPLNEHKAKIRVGRDSYIFDVHAQIMLHENERRYVIVFTDVTYLNELATLDRLTKIPNRFEFDKLLQYSMNLSKRNGKAMSLMLLDLDHFKKINDQLGHLVGDEILVSVSMLLQNSIRKTDMIARWGGEEFVLLFPETDLPAAVKIAETLRTKIETYPFDKVKKVTCSIGVVQFDMFESEDELLKRADDNLYRAKELGRNRVVFRT